ncbi:type IV toxin-antitoxin system AbiEi family antitoxin domain-containing protein [Isoptericola sp. b490]|uniref:type IV toxin-antitoxin system AbiEi family antitoxin domain-containing protein n=1 Tax=Actinotalea lenta TaxID=3064654 RepID=UPI0027130C92|nr:type IV toxin-antitoxin system AbiEi family antitoxin domain-containing protein [Isoptericola sp. b490]MDO8120983.1 type IV toxin-antitoxin system AbiEi family antitoxin domain-containing protein [Isoptericola sp. b490]
MRAPDLPPEVLAALAAQGVVTTASARRVGASRSDLDAWLRRGALTRVARGVYAVATELTPEERYRRWVEAVLTGLPDTVVAGPAAVVLHGLPLLGAAPSVVHVAVEQRHGRKPGRHLHPMGPLDPDDVVRVGRWAVASPARAVLDTARLMGAASGVVAADAALRCRLVSRAALEETCASLAGRTGVRRARRVVRLANPESESPGESWSAVVIDDLGLPAPARQHEHLDGRGLIGRSDFWWPEQSVVGEFDGRVKYGRTNPSGRAPEAVLWDEKRREDRLRAGGRRSVARWTTTELRHPHLLHGLLAPLLRST